MAVWRWMDWILLYCEFCDGTAAAAIQLQQFNSNSSHHTTSDLDEVKELAMAMGKEIGRNEHADE